MRFAGDAIDSAPDELLIAGPLDALRGLGNSIVGRLKNEGRYILKQASKGQLPYQDAMKALTPAAIQGGAAAALTGLGRAARATAGQAGNLLNGGDALRRTFEAKYSGKSPPTVNPVQLGDTQSLADFTPSQYQRYSEGINASRRLGPFASITSDLPSAEELVRVGRSGGGAYLPPKAIAPGGAILSPPIGITGDQWTYNATTMAHEMGHALDYTTPRGRALMQARVRPGAINKGGVLTGIVVGGHREGRDVWGAALEGAAAGLLDAPMRATLESEWRADAAGRRLAKEAGTPWSTANQVVSRSTYPLAGAAAGAWQGAVGELLSEGADQASKWAIDRMDDVGRGIFGKRPPGPMEQALEKYGYDSDRYKFRAGPDSNSLRLQPRN